MAGCGPYTVSVLKIKGPQAATEAGLWALERGCSLSGTMGGVLSLGLAAQGDWEAAQEMLELAPPDPTRRSWVIWAGIALMEGDWSQYVMIREQWSDSQNLDQQILALFDESGVKTKLYNLPLLLD